MRAGIFSLLLGAALFISGMASFGQALAATTTATTAAPASPASTKSTPNSYGIGTISQSNQEEFERFQGAFYLGWAPMTLSQTRLASDNGYSTQFNDSQANGLNLGVRHALSSFKRFAILGDYSVMAAWLKGTFASSQFQVTSSSTTSNLLTMGLAPKLLVAYFLTDNIHPFGGMATSFMYSRLQTPLSGGDNEFFELHYGPMIGLQIVNLPIQQMFFSTEWIQYLKQGENAQRLYTDSGRFQFDLGLNF